MDTKPTAKSLGEELGRELSARTMLFHQAVADRLGLGATDHKCLDLALRAGPDGQVTAGELAAVTGLTSGAITGVLDRLEKAGFVRREKDPSDRRQVLVRLLPDRRREMEEIFEPLARAWGELYSRYDEEQLTLIQGFLRASIGILQQETDRLRARTVEAPPDVPPAETREVSVPLGSAARGRLELPRGAANVEITAGPAELLYRGRFDGWLPRTSHRDGKVVVEYARSILRMLDWRRSSASIELCPAIPWALVVRDGASSVKGRLEGVPLSSVEIQGGLSELALSLPPPRGTVAIRMSGGASHVRLVRPAGVPARVRIDSGASGLTIDTLRLGSVGGETRWESPEYAGATDRYDFEILGGASDLKVTTDALSPEAI